MNQLHYKGSVVGDEDIGDIAHDFKLSYALVAEALDQLRQNGAIDLLRYTGTPRERLRLLVAQVSTNPPPADEPAPIVPDTEPEPQTEPEPADEPTDPAERTEVDEIVDHAATSLMTAFTDPQGCFLINEEGICSINPVNPPTVQQGLEAIRHILKLKELGSVVDDKSSWLLGSAATALETFHGENVFCISQVVEQTSKAYNTIYQAISVFKAFPKHYKLPYSTHQEVHFAKIPDETKKLILHKSEVYQLSSGQARSLCSVAKTMGDDTTIRNIRSRQQAEALIAAYKESRTVYLTYDGEEMREVKRTGKEEPEGKLVINLTDKTFRVNGGKPEDIKR